MTALALGVDVGGTNARAAVVERATGRIIASQRHAWEERAPGAVVEEVARLIERVAAGHEVTGAGVGVGLAAMIHHGVVLNAPNLGWRDVDFATALGERCGRPVTLVNDLSAAAWGEARAGAAVGARHVVTVFVGTGVGSALIVDGALATGATGVAGELGHIKVVTHGGRPCGCGDTGCLEAYVGGARLGAWMREEGLDGTPSDLERLALARQQPAARLYETAVGHLALAVANLVTLMNPEVLVLGGGVLRRCPGMVARTREAASSLSGPAARRAVRVEEARLGDDSGLVGAALLS